jgi:hypothetical protein
MNPSLTSSLDPDDPAAAGSIGCRSNSQEQAAAVAEEGVACFRSAGSDGDFGETWHLGAPLGVLLQSIAKVPKGVQLCPIS